MTSSALHFWDRAETYNSSAWARYVALGDSVRLYTDKHEWDAWNVVGDPVVHVQVRATIFKNALAL